jgi:hypothetical protein
MMHHLAHRPAAVAIGRVELGVAQAGDRRAQALGQQAQRFNMRGANAGHAAGRRAEAPNRIAKVVQIGHGKNFTTPWCFDDVPCRDGTAKKTQRGCDAHGES